MKTLYPIWARMSVEGVQAATRVAVGELLLSGCTTSSDHLYLFPNGVRVDDTIAAANAMGIRFHAARGAMSLGESAGGLPPDSLVENEDAILADMRRVVEAFHDDSRYAMTRVALAPCSPFSVTRELMRESATLARSYGVGLHTHLAENDNDIAYSVERFGCRPGDYAESVGWVGADVWHAHCVKLDHREIARFGATRTGACHCPSSNMRLASGRAPVRTMRDAGMRVGLGVDGSASNDSSNMLHEARQALLLARTAGDAGALSARDVLELATRGGAAFSIATISAPLRPEWLPTSQDFASTRWRSPAPCTTRSRRSSSARRRWPILSSSTDRSVSTKGSSRHRIAAADRAAQQAVGPDDCGLNRCAWPSSR